MPAYDYDVLVVGAGQRSALKRFKIRATGRSPWRTQAPV